VLFRSDLKWALEGRLELVWYTSELHGTISLIRSVNFAAFNAR
jgi:hypothetical protein